MLVPDIVEYTEFEDWHWLIACVHADSTLDPGAITSIHSPKLLNEEIASKEVDDATLIARGAP
tara:strand:+ start:329 stop:517 length:189 start_codon:yes stop_codon:yes gene_type:complete